MTASMGFTRQSSSIYAWGHNSYGQLGTGNTTDTSRPERVALAPGVHPVAISAGSRHSLAIGSDGNVYAWGANAYGQIGDGTRTDRLRPEPITLAQGVKATAISAGGHDSLAIGTDGNVYAWGANAYGQVGDGGGTDRLRPEPITLAQGVNATSISAGYDHSLAVGSDGALYAWGLNINGELGDGTSQSHFRPEVITLAQGVNATAVSAGYDDSLAIGTDGQPYAWGDNCCGQLGDGSNRDRLTPEPIALAPGIGPSMVSAGGDTLAIGSDLVLYGWGIDPYLEGDANDTADARPRRIALASGVAPTSISTGYVGGLIIGSNGKLYAWELNASSPSPYTTFTSTRRVKVIDLMARTISAGGDHNLAIGRATFTSASPEVLVLLVVTAATATAFVISRWRRSVLVRALPVTEAPEWSPYL
jgi:alpha-tubulin suppressor-like RCC1 family protein